MSRIDIDEIREQTKRGKYAFIADFQKENCDTILNIEIQINKASFKGESNVVLRDFSKKYTNANLIKYLTLKGFIVKKVDEFTIKVFW